MSKRLWIVASCVGATAVLAALVNYLQGWRKVAVAFGELHNTVQALPGCANFPAWATALILVAGLGAVGLPIGWTWWKRARAIGKAKKSREDAETLLSQARAERIFWLEPLPPPDVNSPITFERADQRHEEILQWIRASERPLLYVLGHSGTGKSSLMGAFVVPSLNRPLADGGERETLAVMLRGHGDIDATFRETLGKRGVVWDAPPDLSGLSARDVLQRVSARLANLGRRLFLVIDQFEEVLAEVGQDNGEAIPSAVELVKSLCADPIDRVTTILVARAEYSADFTRLGLPKRIEGATMEDVPPFTLPAGAGYLKEKLEARDANDKDYTLIAAALARHAEAADDLPGRVTPIALSMMGVLYIEDPVLGESVARSRLTAADNALAAYVRRRIASKDCAELGSALLKQMTTSEGRREPPQSSRLLAQGIGVAEGRAAMSLVALTRYGIVRCVGDQWEVAHDFLAAGAADDRSS